MDFLVGLIIGVVFISVVVKDNIVTTEDYKLLMEYKEQKALENSKCDTFNHPSNQPSLCKYKISNRSEKIDRCIDIGGFYE